MNHAFIGVAKFAVTFIFNIFVSIVLLRFFLQWVKADFYNPLCQMIIKITNPFLLPLRKIIPGLFSLDVASVVLAYIATLIQVIILTWLNTGLILWSIVFIFALITVLVSAVTLFIYLIIIRAISSWFSSGNYNQALVVIYQLTQPLYNFVYRIIKPAGGFDFAPLIILFVLICINILLGGVSA